LDTESKKGFEEAWNRLEAAREETEKSRSALLEHALGHPCVPIVRDLTERPQSERPAPELQSQNLVLGDQGQSGG